MVDPPASSSQTTATLGRPSLEPLATSPMASSPAHRESVATISTPTGSVEVVSSYSSCDSQQENADLFYTPAEKGSSDSWVPPADLSALKLSRSKIRSDEMPRVRKNSADGSCQASVPLMPRQSSSEKHNNHHNTGNIKSPTLNLPLPPECSMTPMSSLRRGGASAGSKQGNSGGNSITSKAQRYSSLKKKRNQQPKGPNTLLNRLFCNAATSPMLSGGFHDDLKNTDTADADESSVAFGCGTAAHSTSRAEQSDNPLTSACNMSQSFLKQAKEQLTLHDTALISSSIQTSLKDLADCTQSSAAASSCNASADGTNSLPPTNRGLVGDVAVGSRGSKKIYKSSSTDEASVGIEAPKMNMSVNYDDLCGSTNTSAATPHRKFGGNGTDGKPMKTPGGLVIPSPFTHSSKGIFPSTLEATIYTNRSSDKSPKRDRKKGDASSATPSQIGMAKHNSPRSSKSSSNRLAPSEKDRPPRKTADEISTTQQNITACGGTEKTSNSTNKILKQSDGSTTKKRFGIGSGHPDSSAPVIETSTALTETMSSYSTSPDKSNVGRAEPDQDNLSTSSTSSPPFELIRITSSLEDLSTVPEATSSKETSVRDVEEANQSSSHLETIGSTALPLSILSGSSDSFDSPKGVSATVAAAAASLSSSSCNESLACIQNDVKMELRREQDLFAAMASTSDDDDTALSSADPTSPQRTSEQQAADLKSLKMKYERQINEQKDQFKLAQRLACMRLQEIERLESQMDDMKDQQRDNQKVEMERLQSRLDQMQHEKNKAEQRFREEVDLKLAVPRAELESMKQQLSEARVQSMDAKTLKTDFSELQSNLASKNLELKVAHANVEELSSLKLELAAVEDNLSRKDAQLKEAIERAKTAPAPATLVELQRNHERDIESIKLDMQNRIDYHRTKERELQKVSAENIRERDKLAETIEQLQQERLSNPPASLTEVQIKEDLLKQISVLEGKARHLTEDHERALSTVHSKKEEEIRRLRDEMKVKDEALSKKERELTDAISKSNMLEKEELESKLEKAQSSLNTEKSGAELLRIKLKNIENDLKQAFDSELSTKNMEIERLRSEAKVLDDVSRERDEATKELKLVKEKYENDNSVNAELTTELRLQHVKELKAVDERHTEKMAGLEKKMKACETIMAEESAKKMDELAQSHEQELKSCKEDLLQASYKKCAMLNKKHENLMKDTVTKNEKLTMDLQTTEEKYKKLLLEANDQFESYHKTSGERIASLEAELKEKHEQLYTAEYQIVQDKGIKLKYEELKQKQSVYDKEMKTAEENHNKQFEDLLAQLDLVEAEHQGTLMAKEKALLEKEAIVNALGTQLAEAQQKVLVAENLEQKCVTLSEEKNTLESEINSLQQQHKKEMKEAVIAKKKACEDAREEMIEKAEHQFRQANEHYIKLRKQYDESQDRCKKGDSELRLLKKKFEKVTKEKESMDVDLKAEIAQLNAKNATIEAESARKAKEYRRELERMLQTAKDFESEADMYKEKSQNVHSALASAISDKEKLKKEYDEMKSVSEELMAIVEGNERHEC